MLHNLKNRVNSTPADMYGTCRSLRRQNGNYVEVDDTFQDVYMPYLKLAKKFSMVKYTILLIYCIRSMHEHLSLPTYCSQSHARNAKYACSASTCLWIHNILRNLPRFMMNQSIVTEQCSYLLVFFFMSSFLFLYALYLTNRDSDVKIRYRALLVMPSLVFELFFCFLSYYALITSIFIYSNAAHLNPRYYSSAFVIFAFIISVFFALLLVTHFATLYYVMINPVTVYNTSLTSSAAPFNRIGIPRSMHYEGFGPVTPTANAPLISDSYGVYGGGWQQPSNTRANSINNYSHVRSLNGTMHQTLTSHHRPTTRRFMSRNADENDYLELI